jgi:ribosomal silencing factor RsfS
VIEDFYGLDELQYDDDSSPTLSKKKSATDSKTDDQDDLLADSPTSFDLDLAMQLLKRESVQDLVCIQIPAEINYADHMVVGTCASDRHLNSVFATLNKQFKLTRRRSKLQQQEEEEEYMGEDELITVTPPGEVNRHLRRKSGRESKWSALDFGNMVVHLFLPEQREFYDLESLWTCGREFDERTLEFLSDKKRLEERMTYLDADDENDDKAKK